VTVKTVLFLLLISNLTWAAPAPETTKEKKPKYKAGKEMNFDGALVEGQVYRPDLSVVTGDTALGGTGVLRIRKNFVDHMVSENGEVKQ
jgi:hypothetical protein